MTGLRRASVAIALAGTLLVALFAGLGIWQVQRLAWKTALIERVDSRIHAEAVPAPVRAEWDGVDREGDEYRHVSLRGTFLNADEALVQALTEEGAGFWVLTPLLRDNGETVLVNRGFVPPARRDPASRQAPEGPVEIAGLLRITEPDGGFLRANDPQADRWFSRDVAEIARARGLENVAPFFVDADADANPGDSPKGGLTVVSFRNTHLVYALTWFALALMAAGATVFLLRDERRRRAGAKAGGGART